MDYLANEKVKVIPLFFLLFSAVMMPLCKSITFLHNASPRPLPPAGASRRGGRDVSRRPVAGARPRPGLSRARCGRSSPARAQAGVRVRELTVKAPNISINSLSGMPMPLSLTENATFLSSADRFITISPSLQY